MTIEEAKREVKKHLSPKRYRHTKNVAAAARQLAQRWGANPDKAELAGWLHDVVKEKSREALLQMLNGDDIMAGSTKHRPFPVWHGPCACIFIKDRYGVCDEEILSAIACHTTGKEDMSLMDKVVFLADVISAERTFDGVDEIRALAEKDLDAAVLAAMEENIRYLNSTGKKLDEDTLKAVQALKRETAKPAENC